MKEEQLFYRPENAWAADFIPYYNHIDKTYYLYFLLDWRDNDNHGEGTPWYLITTKDFVNFTEHGEILPRGGMEEQDLYVFTGSVIEAEGKYHIFYTGHNPHLQKKGFPQEAIMHAVSDDLIYWEKIPQDTFYAPTEIYEPHDWRDPFVFWNEEEKEYNMLLTARLNNAPYNRKGCTVLCASKDLIKWEVQKTLWASELYFTHECPDLFKIGELWYLIFSEFSDKCATRYRMSKSLCGPWIAPSDDTFGGRAYYAAKTASDGEKRYLFGWIPTKDNNDDNRGWQWGGNLAVHEICQNNDGTLYSKIPETVLKSFLGETQIFPDRTLTAHDSCNLDLMGIPSSGAYKIELDIIFAENTKQCGIVLNYSNKSDTGYSLFIEPPAHRIKFDFFPSWNKPGMKNCERPVELTAGEKNHLCVIVDNTCCVAYLNGKTALSGKMYENNNGQIGLLVIDGEARFENITITNIK